MKTLIIALNSKYIHSALAPWYLKSNCDSQCGDVKVLEYSINDNIESVLSRIYSQRCDVVAFSCYIWNLEYILKISNNLKKILPNVRIILGGPEVSYDAEDILNSNKSIDFVLSGEGEVSFSLLLKSFIDSSIKLDSIRGLSYRENGEVCTSGKFELIEDIDSINSPYTEEMLKSIGNKLIYFESSRGCPFSCAYCISSTFEGVRYFSIERVKSELTKLINSNVRLIKFVDRTFNCNKQRAKEIFEFIIDNAKGTSFHFETAADLFDEEIIDILSKAPKGLIQFEIGVQSTNEAVLDAINRRTSINKVFYYAKKLKELKNIHIHLDLIAGLPMEDYNSFKVSFNDVYALEPDQLQLGFLKLLKGSDIRKNFREFEYEFRDYQPYEVLCNKYISYDEMVRLKVIEEIVDRYYNSSKFCRSLRFVIESCFRSPFEFYEEFSTFYSQKGYLERALSSRDLYFVLFKFAGEIDSGINTKVLSELLKFDFLVSDNSNNLPLGLERNIVIQFKERCYEFLKNEDNIKKFLPELVGIPAKKIYNKVHFEYFTVDFTSDNNDFEEKDIVILFDYNEKNKVTGHYSWKTITL